jgi:hypothetical protein
MKKGKKGISRKPGMGKEKINAQVFSLDTIICVVIFLIVFTIFFAVITKNTQKDTKESLNEEAELLASKLMTEEPNPEKKITIVNNGVLSEEDLNALAEKDTENYQKLKEQLGLSGDFCIFFEDDTGNVTYISEFTGNPDFNDRYGIGNSNITVSGLPCKMG